mgnify:CR=1 FL=1
MPGSNGDSTGGDRRFVPVLANCAMSAGADVLFFEVHPNPDEALCDGPNMLFLKDAEKVTLEAHLVNDLGADSLDAVDIIMGIEDEFGISVDDEKIRWLLDLSFDITSAAYRKKHL